MVLLEYSVEKPLNREPPVDELVSSFITNKGGYDRNHGPIPHIDPARHTISVDGLVKNPLKLSVQDLQSFPQHEVTCALQCAGNRRHTMRTLLKEVDGVDWYDGAVMNCKWRGPRLRDVLLKADVAGGAHVALACHQTACQDDSWFGSSIPLDRGMSLDGEVILALEMNGQPLPINHGFPVRVIAPGIAGARAVKWLDRITVQEGESKNFYQQHDYKILPPEATTKKEAEKYWDSVDAIQDMPVNSVIAVPSSGATVSSDAPIQVRGYALPQGSHGPVVKVEVSVDDGKTWTVATIEESGKWSWALWSTTVTMKRGKGRIFSRATDAGGNVQEACPKWNLRGVGYNGYGESRDLIVT